MRGRIGTAVAIRTAAGHEVIYGITGSGKTTKTKKRITEDIGEDRCAWIVDVDGQSLPHEEDRADFYVATIEGARRLIRNAGLDPRRGWSPARRRLPAPRPLTVTVERAQRVLSDQDCRRYMERLLREAGKMDIRVRLIVNTLDLASFGGSEQIRAAVVQANPIEHALNLYRALTETERELAYKALLDEVAALTSTEPDAPLIRHARSIAGTIESRLLPSVDDDSRRAWAR